MPKKKPGLFPTLDKASLREISARGGAAGRGKKKRRPKEFYSRIAKAYWDKKKGLVA